MYYHIKTGLQMLQVGSETFGYLSLTSRGNIQGASIVCWKFFVWFFFFRLSLRMLRNCKEEKMTSCFTKNNCILPHYHYHIISLLLLYNITNSFTTAAAGSTHYCMPVWPAAFEWNSVP